MMIFPELIFWGLCAGFLGGLLGIGGGLVFVLVIPAVARKLGVPENEMVAVTVANSLACTFFTTFTAGIRRFLSEADIRRGAMIIGLSSTVISLLILRFVVNPGILSPLVFDLVFISIVCYMILRFFLKKESVGRKEEGLQPKKNNAGILLTGLLAGIVSPMSGLGGGIVVVPFLHILLHYPIRMAQSISFGVIAISTLLSTLYNLAEPVDFPPEIRHAGLILLPVVLNIAPSAMLGAVLGTRVAGKINSKWSGRLLLGFLFFILFRKLISFI